MMYFLSHPMSVCWNLMASIPGPSILALPDDKQRQLPLMLLVSSLSVT